MRTVINEIFSLIIQYLLEQLIVSLRNSVKHQ